MVALNMDFFGKKREASSHKKIGRILMDYVHNKDFFQKTGMVELGKYYHMDHRTIRKYLKHHMAKIGTWPKPNHKIIQIDKNLDYFIHDLEKLRQKYDSHLTNSDIEIGKMYLDNLKS